MDKRRESECESIRRLLPDYAVSEGTIPEEAAVLSHLDVCASCSDEFRAIEMTGELLDRTPLEPALDQWSEIRAQLTPREAPTGGFRAREWFGRHRVPSAVGAAAAAVVIAAMLILGPSAPPAELDNEIYMSNHASMSWREPFADKAALGLAAVAQFEVESEN